ncbi:hypothetical protein ACE2AJ_20295 [Aquihabitans daechungensis]|uniref:hypothetical protein n=1 Tax=Aquihabitans daechungensis TaxID=1052257 RepID=UPI003BA09288
MRRFAVLVVALTMGAVVVSCTSDDGDGGGAPTTTSPGTGSAALPASETAGLIPKERWRAQQDEYLEFASGEDLAPGSPLSLLAHATAAERAGEEPDISSATVEDFADTFAKLEAFEDTGDFDINKMLFLWLRHEDDLDPELAAAFEERFLAFKYWWTEPTPEGIVDSQYYWTENHQIIFLANEYVAGQTFPDEVFTNSGMTGEEHVAHAEEELAKWFEWRARFGFSEWLSNVYWSEDMLGTLLLAEFAEDPEIARLASMTLDVMFVELAGHVQDGTFGSTHGRTYQKDKLNGRDEDTFSTVKLAFDNTSVDYDRADNATLLAAAERYRPPEVAKQIANSDETAVFRTKSSLPIDPNAPVDPDVEAPYGTTFEGQDGLMLWWGLGAQFPWQVVPTSVAAVKEYDLFETANFQQAKDLAPVIETTDDAGLQQLALSLGVQVNPGLLSQVDTYTWRSPNVMLSTAQDWRPGQRGEQDHIWQATIDPDTLVFTQHPRVPVSRAEDASDNTSHWTGDGGIPRSAQVENVNISLYDPAYEGDGGVGSGAYSFTYEDYTHAWFPTEHFDEVVQQDGWTIGRKGDGYIALWSARPTEWREYAEGEFTRDLEEDFDLVAPGGPDNAWITEVADASDYDSFEDFVTTITATKPEATGSFLCPDNARCVPTPITVTYDSPSQGVLTYGWDSSKPVGEQVPFTVDGEKVDLHPEGIRWDAPYATAAFDDGVYSAELGGASLELDFTEVTRTTER